MHMQLTLSSSREAPGARALWSGVLALAFALLGALGAAPARAQALPDFTELVEKVMTSKPYATARRVFWIVDNGSSHRGWTAAARLSDAFPNARMIHLPVHASWLNQVEIYFSVVQRKLLTPDDFTNLDDLAAKITAFEDRYNTAARPFDWRFGRDDLNRLLERIAA